MKISLPLISVVVCAHNEEKYIEKCLYALLKALKGQQKSEVIVVADRCTDKTTEKAKKYPILIIEKNSKHWENSYSEALQIGYKYAKGLYLSIIDADIIIPRSFFRDLIPLLRNEIASVSAHVITYPYTFLNRLMNAWEKTYEFAPLGRIPYGAARIILKKSLDELGGFRDVPTPDTDIDLRLQAKGYKSVTIPKVKVYHIRQITTKSIIDGQINCGRGRYALGISLSRTLGHALLRVRPFTVYGWLLEKKLSDKKGLQLRPQTSKNDRV